MKSWKPCMTPEKRKKAPSENSKLFPLDALSGRPTSTIDNLNKCVLGIPWQTQHLRHDSLPKGFTIQLARENIRKSTQRTRQITKEYIYLLCGLKECCLNGQLTEHPRPIRRRPWKEVSSMRSIRMLSRPLLRVTISLGSPIVTPTLPVN